MIFMKSFPFLTEKEAATQTSGRRSSCRPLGGVGPRNIPKARYAAAIEILRGWA